MTPRQVITDRKQALAELERAARAGEMVVNHHPDVEGQQMRAIELHGGLTYLHKDFRLERDEGGQLHIYFDGSESGSKVKGSLLDEIDAEGKRRIRLGNETAALFDQQRIGQRI